MNKNKRGESSILDNFFTSPDVASVCIEMVCDFYAKEMSAWDIIIEPSAGNGSFLTLLPEKKRKGYDIAPKTAGIEEVDFLTVSADSITGGKSKHNILFIGNPPFGKNGSLALKFLERALTMADHVAFILPRSFQKVSMQNNVKDRQVHVVFEKIVRENAFQYENEVRDVPCVFQIWARKPEYPERAKLVQKIEHPAFKFVHPSEEDIDKKEIFSVQRVGQRAGQVITNRDELKRKRTSRNFYFIEPKDGEVVKKMKGLDLEHIPAKYKTAGMPSISKSELIEAFDEQLLNDESGNCLCFSCNKK